MGSERKDKATPWKSWFDIMNEAREGEKREAQYEPRVPNDPMEDDAWQGRKDAENHQVD